MIVGAPESPRERAPAGRAKGVPNHPALPENGRLRSDVLTVPLVSVILAVQKGMRLTAEAAESLLAQTSNSDESMAINDGSTDGTHATLRRSELGDTCVRLCHPQDLAMIALYNRGCHLAKGCHIPRTDVRLPCTRGVDSPGETRAADAQTRAIWIGKRSGPPAMQALLARASGRRAGSRS